MDKKEIAKRFGISHEALKRILHSKFTPSGERGKRQEEKKIAKRLERKAVITKSAIERNENKHQKKQSAEHVEELIEPLELVESQNISMHMK